jgi:hypothetical protein
MLTNTTRQQEAIELHMDIVLFLHRLPEELDRR